MTQDAMPAPIASWPGMSLATTAVPLESASMTE